MASAEVNPPQQASPLFWSHLAQWIRSIPRSALLSMVGPSLLLICGYFGWRYYGARHYDAAFYGVKKENVTITAAPDWLRTSIVDEVFSKTGLSHLSLLDAQSPAIIARAFDAHPAVLKTHRVQPFAGGEISISIEYRTPVAMLYCEPEREGEKPEFLPLDAEGVLLPVKGNFTETDVPRYIWIYVEGMKRPNQNEGTRIGDTRVEEATKLCKLLAPYRNHALIERVYVVPARSPGKSRWNLEIETNGGKGPRIIWGNAPGFEGMREPSASEKLRKLIDAVSDRSQWSKAQINLMN